MLYDEKFVTSLPEAYHFENPWVQALCAYEQNKSLRELLEVWYKDLPSELKPKFYDRLRSLENQTSIPAIYELMIYRFCIEEGWTVEYEAVLDSGFQPDLLVTTKAGNKFIIEVASLFESRELKVANKQKRELTERISKLKTDHILELNYLSHPKPDGRPRAAADRAQKWLDDWKPSDPKRCGFGATGTGFHFEININDKLPKPSKGCLFSISDVGGQLPDYSERYQSVIDKKRKKFSSRKTGIPLIVMIGDAIGFLSGDSGAIDRALFGRHTITFGGEESTAWGRDGSGYFEPRRQSNGRLAGRNTGVSAVLYASIKENGTFLMTLSNNPFPNKPIDENILSKLPQLQVLQQEGRLNMKWVISESQVENQRIGFSAYNFDLGIED